MPFDTKSDKFSESAELFSHTLLCLGGIYCWSMMMIWNMRPSLPVPGSPLRDNWLEWGPRADGGRGLKFGQETSLLQTIMMTICNAMNSPPQNGRQENFGHKRNLYFFLHNPRPGKPTLKVRLRLIFCRATHRIFHFCKIFSQNFTLLFCRHENISIGTLYATVRQSIRIVTATTGSEVLKFWTPGYVKHPGYILVKDF